MKPMYINGQWVTSSDGQTIEVYNPATEELLDTVPNGSASDAVKAIQAAKNAYNDWRWVTAYERADMLQEAANKLGNCRDEVVELLTLEEGKAISENEEEVEWVIGTLKYYAGLIRNQRGRVLAPADRSNSTLSLKSHLGWWPVLCPLTIRCC